jgi:predicted GTPase
VTAVTDQDQDHTERAEQPGDADKARSAENPSAKVSESAPENSPETASKNAPGGEGASGTHARVPDGDRPTRTDSRTESTGSWDDGLIARRVDETTAGNQYAVLDSRTAAPPTVSPLVYDGPLRSRLEALRELVGLSRTRLDSRTLAEAGRVLDEASARRRLSGQHTVVAIAGATGSGKSQLFNALAGVAISETGVRRPTTAAPIACSWSDGAASLIERLGIPPRLRRRPLPTGDGDQLRGLVLIDLPDHDSAAVQHREHVDRILALVDAVIWVVDPEKYADAVLHERYLRPMAAHAEVMFVVLNQIDRLPGDAAEQVLDDLRRLLDEDGIALGEYGEPGTTVLALSGLTGDGVGELREALGQFVAERTAPARRISADVDIAAARPDRTQRTGPGGVRRPARGRRGRHGGGRGRRTRVAAQRQPRLRHALAAVVALVPGPRRAHHGTAPLAYAGRRGGHRPAAGRAGGTDGGRPGLGRSARALGAGGA